jgi:transcription-repair coupling factor (superfamily II helicase)
MASNFKNSAKEIAPLLSLPGSHITLAGLTGSAPAYLLSRLLHEIKHPFLVITKDPESAEQLWQELIFYAGENTEVLYFPAWETSPFEQASPHADITGRRLYALFRLMEGKVRAVVAPLTAVLQKVLPQSLLGNVSQYLVAGEEVEREAFLAKLVRLGYANVPLVEDRGTFSTRGGIIDIFPPDLPAPVRIDFFGDFIDTIRYFDPLTQRSLKPLDELIVLPSREVILSEEVLQEFIPLLKSRCDLLEISATRRRDLVEQLN